ncbi:hypothetical protein XarjCFBP7653_01670 [Xanthomonas arboricola]|nr:hypothetical protein XarjCFBP7653_01670 [Xanthomonas arboricola]
MENPVKSPVGRGCGALTACGTRREPILGGSVAASMPPHGPATGEGTAPDSWLVGCLKGVSVDRSALWDASLSEQQIPVPALTKHTGHLDWSLPAHRRGTLRGMDAA